MSTDHLDPADTAPGSQGADPSDLPVFAPVTAPRPGRVRGAFTMTPTPETATAQPTVPVARALPRPFSGALDWALVTALWLVAGPALSGVFESAIDGVTGP